MGFLRRILFGSTNEEPTAAPEPKLPVKQDAVVPDPLPVVKSETIEVAGNDAFATRPLGIKNSAAALAPHPTEDEGDRETVEIAEDIMSPTTTGYIHLGQISNVGLVRTNNQDSAFSFYVRSDSVDNRSPFGLFVVADGMGGHLDGEKASAITINVLATQVINHIYMPFHNGEKDPDQPPHTELLVKAVQAANKEVIKQVVDGGTTVTAALVVGSWVHVAHVGDSRAYLITKDGIEQVTRDHSVVQRLIELDQLTPEEAVNHPRKNVLYRALGQNESLEVDIFTRRLPPDTHMLICSDGLWGLVDEKDLYEKTMNTKNPQEACEQLVELANIQGGIDNITAILLNAH